MKKRALCALLAVLLCISLLPLPAMAAEDVEINESSFPDPFFRDKLAIGINHETDKPYDVNRDGFLSEEELAEITDLGIAGDPIQSLKGIEFFTELWAMDCGETLISELDVTKNPKLYALRCGDTQLVSLDVTKNPVLEILDCRNLQLTALNVTKNPLLQSLNCWHNRLTALDVSKNTQLTRLVVSNNELKTLDVSGNTKLQQLYCSGNRLKTLDIHTIPALIKAYLEHYRTGDDDGIYGDQNIFFTDAESLVIDCTTELIVDSNCMPVISAQPADRAARVGERVVFQVEAKGEDLLYQWYCRKPGGSWQVMSGERKTELSLTVDQAKNGNQYCCAVSGDGGRKISVEAKLTVVTKPKITTQPKTATVKAGKKVTFKVKASGEELKYQWYVKKTGSKKWVKVKKATKPTLKFKATVKMNGYKYRCKVYNAAGYVYSKTVKLKVKKK